MGQKIVLSGVNFTDESLPVLRDDPLLSAGSLVLVDFGHSLGGIDAVPTNGELIPNVAGSIASGLVDSASVSPFVVTSFNAASMVPELSLKGGLHVIKSKVGDVSTTRFVVSLPTSIETYVYTNKTHQFFYSVWHEVTRKADHTDLPLMALAESSFSVNYIMNLQSSGVPGGVRRKSNR